MSRRGKRDWTPATTFKVTKLKPNGPKPGQSTEAWLYGKTKADERKLDDLRTPMDPRS